MHKYATITHVVAEQKTLQIVIKIFAMQRSCIKKSDPGDTKEEANKLGNPAKKEIDS